MKWNKDIIIQELIDIKNRDGQVNCGHIHENYTPLRGAVYRYFDSFDQALECAGFDPSQETKSSTISEETRKKISQSRLGKYKGKDNSMYGKSHTKTSKELMSQNLKEYLNNRNIRFLRLWGSDIKGNPNDCENKILNLIRETT